MQVQQGLFDYNSNAIQASSFDVKTKSFKVRASSPVLKRIVEANLEQNRKEYTLEGCFLPSQNNVAKNLLWSVILLAFIDIETAMRRPDPMYMARKTKTLDRDFSSAITFVFGCNLASVDTKPKLQKYSTFNAYCELLGFSAPVIRRKILDKYPSLMPYVLNILGDNVPLAPILTVN